jgi:hypothetical protein
VKKCSPITRLERIEWEQIQRMLTYHKRRERERETDWEETENAQVHQKSREN